MHCFPSYLFSSGELLLAMAYLWYIVQSLLWHVCCVCLFCFPLDSKHKMNETKREMEKNEQLSRLIKCTSTVEMCLLCYLFSSFIISFSMLYNVNTQTKANVLQRKMQQWNHLISQMNLQLSHSLTLFSIFFGLLPMLREMTLLLHPEMQSPSCKRDHLRHYISMWMTATLTSAQCQNCV